MQLLFITETKKILEKPGVKFLVTMSSTRKKYSAEKVVDGIFGPDPETCDCCGETVYSERSWWSVDLGQIYSLRIIEIYGRSDGR